MLDLNSLLNTVTVIAAAATVLAVQLLKSPLIPVRFEQYPVPTTIGASAIATYFALLSQHFNFAVHSVASIVSTFVVVLLVAALTYTHVIAQWPFAKSLEASKNASGPTSAGN